MMCGVGATGIDYVGVQACAFSLKGFSKYRCECETRARWLVLPVAGFHTTLFT